MTVTLNLPPTLERTVQDEARAREISLDEWVREAVIARAQTEKRSFAPRKSRLWDLRQDLELGDLSIRDLIAEGRE